MGLFSKPEVTILKESNNAIDYLGKLEAMQKEASPGTKLYDALEKEIAIIKAGILGEEAILYELKNSGMDLVVLHDLYIETEDGRGAQIDYIVITPDANVFIECKNLFGNITIDNKGNFIREFSFGRHKVKEGIYSPVSQNERHLRLFKEDRASTKGAIVGAIYKKNFENYNKSFVVLANSKTVLNDRFAPKEVKSQVIKVDRLVSELASIKTDRKLSKKEMINLGEQFLAMNKDDRKDYSERFEKLKAEAEDNKQQEESHNNTEMICPFCGKKLVLRTAKKGVNEGRQFYGCSGFPMCRYIKNI